MADRPRRPLLLTALAVLLAAESVAAVAVHAAVPGAVLARAGSVTTTPNEASAIGTASDAETRALFADPADSPADDAGRLADDGRVLAGIASASTVVAERPVEKPGAAASAATTGIRGTVRESTVRPSRGSGGSPSGGRYVGRNHMWIPALGVSRSVAGFACSRATPPGHLVYRWGCAGRNNVYLFGHASSVFRPLHDAYVRGRLKVGMQVLYADGGGTVRTYAVRSWRVLAPDGDVAWAIAAQSVPSMTLQTCVGSNSERRLVVRLVRVSG